MVAKVDLSDTFQRADGLLSGSSQKTADSNHVWSTSGVHSNSIDGGYLTMTDDAGDTDNGGGGYAYVDLQTTPKRISATFRFTDAEVGTSTSTNSAALVLISSRNENAVARLEHMIHFKVTMAGWAFQYREHNEGTPWPFISQGSWDTVLSKDTDYTFTIELLGPTIKAYCPDGSTKEVTLARFPSIYGPYLVFQTAYSTDNNDPKILVSSVEANNSLRSFV